MSLLIVYSGTPDERGKTTRSRLRQSRRSAVLQGNQQIMSALGERVPQKIPDAGNVSPFLASGKKVLSSYNVASLTSGAASVFDARGGIFLTDSPGKNQCGSHATPVGDGKKHEAKLLSCESIYLLTMSGMTYRCPFIHWVNRYVQNVFPEHVAFAVHKRYSLEGHTLRRLEETDGQLLVDDHFL